jgi:uncharacterized membrane protein
VSALRQPGGKRSGENGMKSKTRAALLLVAVFLLGGTAGGIAYYLFQNHFAAAQPEKLPIPNSHDIVEEMAQQLFLDAGQKEQLRTIIQRSREQYRTLSRQFQPRYDMIRGETNEAIRGILKEDQRKHFDETLQRMDSGRGNRLGAPPPQRPDRDKSGRGNRLGAPPPDFAK